MFIKKQVLKYWNKLEKCSHESILYNCLLSEKSVHNQNMSSWYTVIVNTMVDSMWDADKINKKYIDLVASKIVQVHRQNIVEYPDKAGSSTEGYKIRTYAKIKKVLKMEPYLMSKLNIREKIQISKFRVGDHNLHIETGRHCKPKRQLKKELVANVAQLKMKYIFLLTVYCMMNQELNISW